MPVYLLNYSDSRFNKRHAQDQEIQNTSASKIGIPRKNIISWTRNRLCSTQFYKNHKRILDTPKGAGLWLWNPFLTYKYLQSLTCDDFLVYADSDIPFVGNIDVLLQVCEANGGMFHMRRKFQNVYYTKQYCLKRLGCISPRFLNGYMIAAGFVILKKNARTLGFYKEYLQLCCDIKLIDDNTYDVPNHKRFIDHRHPMSVLSLLHKKYNLPAFCAPADMDILNHEMPPNIQSEKSVYNKMFNAYEKRMSNKYLGTQLLGGQLGAYKNKKKLQALKQRLRSKK